MVNFLNIISSKLRGLANFSNTLKATLLACCMIVTNLVIAVAIGTEGTPSRASLSSLGRLAAAAASAAAKTKSAAASAASAASAAASAASAAAEELVARSGALPEGPEKGKRLFTASTASKL